MSNVTLFGLPRSTFVKVAGLILTARNVDYHFHDTEDEMYLPVHLERHPFARVPALQHDDFMRYETKCAAERGPLQRQAAAAAPDRARARVGTPSSSRGLSRQCPGLSTAARSAAAQPSVVSTPLGDER
jgi:hypothetical protein